MTPFTSILVATDLSIDGHNAMHRAALLAHEHGARLQLVHVLDPAGSQALRGRFRSSTDFDLEAAQARAALRRCAVEMAGRYDVSASVELKLGAPLETPMQAAEHAELLVVGRRMRGRFSALWTGRGVDRLLGTCRRPVLVVKTPAAAAYRRLLVPLDFTAPADATVQAAARLALDSDVQVFHVINSHREAVLRDSDVPEHLIRESRLRQEAGVIARLHRKAARLGLDHRRTGFAVAHGHPVDSILSHAHRLGADLIVAGKQQRSTLGEVLLGSVSRRVLAECRCDMLIVPQPGKHAPAHATPPPWRPAQPTAPAGHAAPVWPGRVA